MCAGKKDMVAMRSFCMTSKTAHWRSYAWKNVVPKGLSALLALLTSGSPDVRHGTNAARTSLHVESTSTTAAAAAAAPSGASGCGTARHNAFE